MPIVKTARLTRGWAVLIAILLIATVIAWLTRHIVVIAVGSTIGTNRLNLIWLFSFILIAWTSLMAVLERPYTVTDKQAAELAKLKVAILIPAYNEDPALLQACIESMLIQTRLPHSIVVVDDGSKTDYGSVIDWMKHTNKQGVNIQWFRTDNGGKRHAQVTGMNHTPDADIYLTVDSDTILDPKAIEEGMKPFRDPRVQSVGGVCLPLNVEDNLLTRFTGLWETVWQLVDRSAQSTFKSVTVNSGVLAFYRGYTVRAYTKSYLSETFMGRPVKFSDDSLLTMYAMTHGLTVQQPTSLCFSAVPNKVNHHIRRYTRWMRGSFIRTWWRFKYLPMHRYVYWLHLTRWVQFFLSVFIFIYLVMHGAFVNPAVLPYFIAVPIAIGYMQSLRYLTIRRSDVSFKSEVLTYLTAPIAIVWALVVLRFVKYYAYLTVFNTKWGTRSEVEVGFARTSPGVPGEAVHD